MYSEDVFSGCTVNGCNDSFDDTFGTFKPMGVGEQTYKPSVVVTVSDGSAHVCRECGHFPRVHEVCFKDKETHNKRFYADCECCGSCDGEWYETSEDAVSAWNASNPNEESAPANESEMAKRKFISEIMERDEV